MEADHIGEDEANRIQDVGRKIAEYSQEWGVGGAYFYEEKYYIFHWRYCTVNAEVFDTAEEALASAIESI